jgi:hypothetical protein
MSMIASLLAVSVPLARLFCQAQLLYSIESDYLTRLDSDFFLAHTEGGAYRRLEVDRSGRKVTSMARPEHGQPEPDPYQLLGVAHQAPPAEITRAWRRRARAEHPDARPRDVGAPDRFCALADAYEMLSDPRRRAAYDQAARMPEPASRAHRPAAGTAVRVIVLSPPEPPSPGPAMAPAPAGDAPLWAGPVRVEPPTVPLGRGAAPDQRAWLVLRAETAARYLDGIREWPW